MTYTTLALVLATTLACNEEKISMSTDIPSKPLDAIPDTRQQVPPPVVAEEAPAPKKWPKCWLSVRLSAMNAFRISGFGAETTNELLYKPSDGRQEFRGKLKNPSAVGDCVLNWLGQENNSEPWAKQLEAKQPNMSSALTCTADATPDCTCVSLIPKPPYDSGIRIDFGWCVRDAANGGHQLYNYRDPDSSRTIPSEGRCNDVFADTKAFGVERMGSNNTFLQQSQDSQHTGKSGSTCRTDIEPFAPLNDEKDWYADEIRDWAITTCTDQTTNCRCYTIHNKSGFEEGKRGRGFEHGTCLLCADGTCQHATLP